MVPWLWRARLRPSRWKRLGRSLALPNEGAVALAARVVGPADDLGETPIEDHDFAKIAQDHVLALEVAVNDPAGVRVGHRVAGADECVQKRDQVERPGRPLPAFLVVGAGGVRERAALE